MFQFSAFASLNLCIQFRMTALVALPGFPIQKSSGHSSFDNSLKLIAVYYVFHRLSAPRHPPCALYSLISIPLLRNEVMMTKIILNCCIPTTLRHLMTHKFLNLCDILSLVCLDLYRFLLFCCQSAASSFLNPSTRSGLYAPRAKLSNYFFQKNASSVFECAKSSIFNGLRRIGQSTLGCRAPTLGSPRIGTNTPHAFASSRHAHATGMRTITNQMRPTGRIPPAPRRGA